MPEETPNILNILVGRREFDQNGFNNKNIVT